MTLDFSRGKINFVFEVTDDKDIMLIDLSYGNYKAPHRKYQKWSMPVNIHLSGGNPNEHHGGKHSEASENPTLKYVSHKFYENAEGEKLELLLANDKLSVVQHYQFYKSADTIRSWCDITNISKDSVGLEYVSSFAYTGLEDQDPYVYLPHNAWCSEFGWKKYSISQLGLEKNFRWPTKRISATNTGTWSSKEYLPMGAYSDKNTTFLWQIEHNGSWHWEISYAVDMLYLKLSGPTEQENGWYKELLPNESFESVKCCIAVGSSFDSALEQMTRYRRTIFKNNIPNSMLPIIFNDYMNCVNGDPTTEKLLPVIDKASETGAEYFCVDAGWYADGAWWDTVGEWQPCDWRFPNGIKQVFDYIREKGMIPGIWLEIEVMGINCPILDKFDDSCFFMRHGKRVIDHGRYQLDFRNKKVRDYANSTVDRIISDYGIGYIKFDYNIDGGLGTEVDSDSFGDGLLKYNRAFLNWVDELKARHPDLIMENCASGGMRMDYAMLTRYHLQSTSDQYDYDRTSPVAANCPTAVLPEQAAVWSYPLSQKDSNNTAFNMVSSMLTRIHLSGGITGLSDEQFEEVKEGVRLYKEYRHLIPTFIPFYPLGLNSYEDDFNCVGYKAGEEKYIAVWRKNSEEDTIFVPVEDASKAKIIYPSKRKGSIDANQNGIYVTLPDKLSAVLIRI